MGVWVVLVGCRDDWSDLATIQMHKDKLRILAIFAQQRSKRFPDVSALKEPGYDPPFGYTVLGVCGPPHLPEDTQKSHLNTMAKQEFLLHQDHEEE